MMATALAQQPGSERRGSLRRYGTCRQPEMRLVCFPWCGAGASVYRKLAACLPEHIELLAVQLPGREDRFGETRLLRMDQVVDHVFNDIAALRDRPLMLFGHSMGALVAYRMALALQARTGRGSDALVLSGYGAPGCGKPDARHWHTATDDAFIANLARLGGTPAAILEDSQMMRLLLPVLRADYEVLETCTDSPDSVLSCPLLACAGDRDHAVSIDAVAAWRRRSTGSSKIHRFSGDHFYLAAQPQALAQYLTEWSAEWRANTKESIE
ncbi:alpha/beta fold hydrolase [Pseudoduganella sp. LjRoot289]|uniref:thioesterase II family protein n=1 Tax=Pseudoduganella sp. LjRoot289 TaxID=3342314 RepID=UPI003ED08D5A